MKKIKKTPTKIKNKKKKIKNPKHSGKQFNLLLKGTSYFCLTLRFKAKPNYGNLFGFCLSSTLFHQSIRSFKLI